MTKGRPTAIIARTFKGKNYPSIEDQENWHGKPLGTESERVVNVSTAFEPCSYAFLIAELFQIIQMQFVTAAFEAAHQKSWRKSSASKQARCGGSGSQSDQLEDV